MRNIFGDRLIICLCSDWSGQVKFQQPKYSIKHNCERLIVHIHNYSVKPVTIKSNLIVCLSVIFFSLCSAELAKETYFHVKLWDHSSATQPIPGIQIERGSSKNRMQFYCFNFIFFFKSTSALAEQVTGQLAPKSFCPSNLAPYFRTRNIIFEEYLFWYYITFWSTVVLLYGL